MSEDVAAPLLSSLRSRGALGRLDAHFAEMMAALVNEEDELVVLAAALVSRAVSLGHVCLDLRTLVARELRADDGSAVAVAWPTMEAWIGSLNRSRLVAVVGPAPQPPSPLILDHERLYLRRYWLYETRLAAKLTERAGAVEPAVDRADLAVLADRLFGPGDHGVDWQRRAAEVALSRRLCVITGGPGTGKTHTVANLLVLLAESERRRRGRLPDVLVLAPTGKAANRLSESLAERASRLPCDQEIRTLVAAKASTIHRALRPDRAWRTRFRHDSDHPLRADVVVVDEASMVDIALMTRLLDAVPAPAHLILLGDRDQLASVESGAILADLCGDASTPEAAEAGEAADEPAVARSIVHLRRNFRYSERSDIGRLAAAINRGDEEEVLAILSAERDGSVRLRGSSEIDSGLCDAAVDRLEPLFGNALPEEKLALLASFRILCALRRGPFGVETLNLEIESKLRDRGRIAAGAEMYSGRPLMVLHNDRDTGLFNGDIGLVERLGDGHTVYFPDGEGARAVSLGRLPVCETVYAMTIHKSQGSEFDEVAVVLPDRSSPILTRELLYTAVTRAKARVTVYASPEVVGAAVRRRVERASGLARRLGWAREAEPDSAG